MTKKTLAETLLDAIFVLLQGEQTVREADRALFDAKDKTYAANIKLLAEMHTLIRLEMASSSEGNGLLHTPTSGTVQ